MIKNDYQKKTELSRVQALPRPEKMVKSSSSCIAKAPIKILLFLSCSEGANVSVQIPEYDGLSLACFYHGQLLHDLVLSQAAMRIGVHCIAGTGCDVLDEAEAQGTSAVLVALELGDGGIGGLSAVKANDTGATGPAAGFVLNLCLLHFADGREKLNEIVVASGPRKLSKESD